MPPKRGDLIAARVVAEPEEYLGQIESGSRTCLSLLQSWSEMKLQSPLPQLRQDLLPGNCLLCLSFQHLASIFTFCWDQRGHLLDQQEGDLQSRDHLQHFRSSGNKEQE
jgi:hypothetical protein